MPASATLHSSISVPESIGYYNIISSMSGSSVSTGRSNRTKGNKVPRQGFLKLAKSRHFVTMIEIIDRPDDYDLDSWLFPGAETLPGTTSPSVSGITSPLEYPTKSLNTSSDSSSSIIRRPSFRHISALTKSSSTSQLLPGRNDEYNLHLFRGETPLHVLLRYNPPEELVSSLIDYLSHSEKSLGVPEDSVDMLGRTPLHVACANGCSVAVIGRLINGVSAAMPAFAKDTMGRHALHWACANSNGEFLENKSFRRLRNNAFGENMLDNNMVNVIKVLLKAYPEAVFIADNNGNRPKDLARINKANERIILMLSREERNCELENDYHKNFASVAESTVVRGNSRTIPTTLPFDRSRDDVSSIGSNGMSYYEPKAEKKFALKGSLEKSPFQKMENKDEVVDVVEQKIMFRPPLALDAFDQSMQKER